MQNSNIFGASQTGASLKRETTEDMSKMYTTLFDNEDPQQQQEFVQHRQLYRETQVFVDDLLNNTVYASQQQQPYIPEFHTSPCYSSASSSSGSPESSPATGLIKMMDADEASELVDLFNITIDDLLSVNPLAFLSDPAMSKMSLFAPQAQQAAALHFEIHNNTQAMMALSIDQELLQYQQQQQLLQEQQQYHNLHSQSSSTVGPHRSNSLSPVMSCAPYHATQHHHQHNYSCHHNYNCPSSSSSSPTSPALRSFPSCGLHFLPQSPEQYYIDSTMAQSPATTCTGSSSSCPSPAMSTAAASISSTMTTTTVLNTDGLTMIKNEDGSIMVYNPVTESMTFRCELCPSESFGRIHDLKRHQASKHQDITWPCEFCSRPFVRRDALLRHYTVKSAREDGVHPTKDETEKLKGARARAKLIC